MLWELEESREYSCCKNAVYQLARRVRFSALVTRNGIQDAGSSAKWALENGGGTAHEAEG